jgi:hypothetical protein
MTLRQRESEAFSSNPNEYWFIRGESDRINLALMEIRSNELNSVMIADPAGGHWRFR